MASYGVFLAACGFEYHGPHGHLGFAPRLTPDDFRAPFTAAEGWGTYTQKVTQGKLSAEIHLKWGRLRVQTVALDAADLAKPASVTVHVNGKRVPASLSLTGSRAMVTLASAVEITASEKIGVALG